MDKAKAGTRISILRCIEVSIAKGTAIFVENGMRFAVVRVGTKRDFRGRVCGVWALTGEYTY